MKTYLMLCTFLVAFSALTAQAAVLINGDVEPDDPDDWNSSTNGYVGKTGVGTLEVNDGSDLYSCFGIIGHETTATGQVTVTGAGSTWVNKPRLYIGRSGSGTLNITSGGAVSASDSSYIGHDATATGQVSVSGAGSTWTNGGDLSVGRSGTGTLNITGGTVCNEDGYIGYYSGSTGAATVDGAGSTWTNSGNLYIGDSGSGTLNIAGGGAVTTAVTTYVGYYTDSTGTIDFGTGGGTLTTQTLYALPTQLKGTGTIDTRGLVSDVDLVFDSATGPSPTLLFDSQPGQNVTVNLDMGSDPSSNGDLGVGWKGNGTLTIQDGIKVTSPWSYLGYNSGSTGVATVSGAGSTWTTGARRFVGYNGSGSLNIIGGGSVNDPTSVYLGYNSGSTGAVTVDGTGSTWTTGPLHVGHLGNGTLNVIGGADVSSNYCKIGFQSEVTVDGAGSTWTTSLLDVGYYGSGTLNITGGGEVSNPGTFIGPNSGSTGDVTVDGIGSKLNIGSHFIGCYGSGTLNITGGGNIDNSNGYLGFYSGSTGEATVGGTGSTWTSNYLYVGYDGSGRLNISDGGTVSNYQCCIGKGYGSTGKVTVDGAGSTCTTSDLLYVGYNGSGTLNITGGGDVNNNYGYIGTNSGSTGVVTVDGTGSTWTNSSSLCVGYSGNGTLHIIGGGAVTATGATYVGCNTGSTGTIDFGTGGGTLMTQTLYASPTQLTGMGTIDTRGLVSDIDLVFDSVESLSQTLTFNGQTGQNVTVNLDMASDASSNGGLGAGWKGNGSLTIRDGVMVNSQSGYIGYSSGSTGVVTVDGAGSSWTNDYYLYVGHYGSGTLNITAGGVVSNSTGSLGSYSGSTGVATLDGAGSTWTNNDDLYLGRYGMGSVTQTGGTISVAGSLCLGYYSIGQGTYNLNGGTLLLKALVKGSGTAAFNFGGGTLQASDDFSTSMHMTLTGEGGDANVDTAGCAVTLSGVLSGTGGLNKLGDGALTLSAPNSYSNDTSVLAGILEIAGGIDPNGTALIDVQSDAVLKMKTTNVSKADLNIFTADLAMFQVADGTHEVGAIMGSGNTRVDSGATLIATSIYQDTLSVGSGGRVIIKPLSGGSAGSMQSVPEPSTFLLLIAAVLGLLVHARWKRK